MTVESLSRSLCCASLFSATGNPEERQPAAARRERRPHPRDIPPLPLTPVPGAPHAGSAPADGAAGEGVDPATDAAVAQAAAATTAAAKDEAEAAALMRRKARPRGERGRGAEVGFPGESCG